MSDLVGTPQCWFSHAQAHLNHKLFSKISVRPRKVQFTASFGIINNISIMFKANQFKVKYRLHKKHCKSCKATSIQTNLNFIKTGGSCSKLTTSLVNNLLKYQTAILQIHCYFLLKKCKNPLHCTAKDSRIFSTKNNSVFAFEVVVLLTN